MNSMIKEIEMVIAHQIKVVYSTFVCSPFPWGENIASFQKIPFFNVIDNVNRSMTNRQCTRFGAVTTCHISSYYMSII